MIAKTIEIRDRMTLIPALAVRLTPTTPGDRFLLARAGYGLTPLEQEQYILLSNVNGGGGAQTSDPYDWGDRTMATAHRWLVEHFDEIESGAVVDVEFILGEKPEPAESEAT